MKPFSGEGVLSFVLSATDVATTERAHHVVAFYEGDAFLIASIVDHLQPSLDAGCPGLVVATPEHGEAVVAQVAERHGRAVADRVKVIDANTLLQSFLVGDMPDPDRFEAEVGGLLDGAAEHGVPVRVFGEMVALLWERGNVPAAMAVEDLWNRLAATRDFELLCGYPMQAFAPEEDAGSFRKVCAHHTRVIPAESYSRLDDADARLRAVALLQHERVSGGRERRALREEHDELEAAVARLEDMERLRRQFVAMLVHDIRGPAVVIGASLKLLSEEWEDLDVQSARTLLDGAASSADRIERLASDLLTMARLESGEFSYQLAPLALDRLAEQVAGQVTAASGRRIEVDGLVAPLPAALADEQRQMQVLTNLLSNAAKFSPDGSPIRVTIRPAQDHLVVSVHDEGVGIAAEELPRLFQPFLRLRPHEPGVDGSGLGLYTAKALVEGQGGRLWVDSEPGRGSTFSYTVPLAPPR